MITIYWALKEIVQDSFKQKLFSDVWRMTVPFSYATDSDVVLPSEVLGELMQAVSTSTAAPNAVRMRVVSVEWQRYLAVVEAEVDVHTLHGG